MAWPETANPMKFGPRPVNECGGHILAHSVKVAGRRFSKGICLKDEDIAYLGAGGLTELVIAEAEPGDIHEDDVANRLAQALAPHGVSLTIAATGRVNLKVQDTSLIGVFSERLTAFNLIDEGLTCATVQHHQLLSAGQMAATLKIVPYFLPAEVVEAAEKLLANGPLFTCHRLTGCDAGLIQTVSPAVKQTVRTATHNVTEARLSALGCRLISSVECAHDSAAITAELHKMRETGIALILICGASAISDRRDIVPAAVTLAGGRIEQLGLAVDPGNLTMVAGIDDTMVIGMPGCARSPRLNGLDWILHLYLAGLDIDRLALASMATGGLLMEIASRPLPRALAPDFVPSKHSAGSAAPYLAGLILAAGQSRRMGNENKLLMLLGGVPLIRHTTMMLLAAGCVDITIVTGHDAEAIRHAVEGLDVRFVQAHDYAKGQGHSLRAGILALPEKASDVLVMLGDMPLVSAELVSQLMAHHARQPGHDGVISLPICDGRRGHPVIWGRRFFDELATISGDSGGRVLLADYAHALRPFDWDRPEMFLDADTQDAFAQIKQAYEADQTPS